MQLPNEARYRITTQGSNDTNDLRFDLAVDRSVMSDLQPLVPVGYGTEHYEKQEGSGGLSAAATDIARLIAILMLQKDSPAMKRSTIDLMLNNAVAAQMKWGGRAGHGFDGERCTPITGSMGRKAGRSKLHVMCFNSTGIGALSATGPRAPNGLRTAKESIRIFPR